MSHERRAPLLAASVAVSLLFATAGLSAAPSKPPEPEPGPRGAAGSPPTTGAEAPGTPSAEEGPSQAYKRHLDNGVRLWRDQNYRAAITEFEAAYRAEPKASPLVNIALCRKALLEYPQAVQALRSALDQHGDTLEPEVRAAAEKEVRELEARIGYVTVNTDPPGATVVIDGVEHGHAGTGPAIALSPGPHEVEALLDGYAPVKVRIEIEAGQHRRDLVMKLQPSMGKVRVVPTESAAFVEVDQRAPVQAGWEGQLEPGEHVVRVRAADGTVTTARVVVRAGDNIVITQQADGSLAGPSVVRVEATAPEIEEPPDEPRTGFFLHGGAALLFIGGTAPEGITARSGGGVGLGLRLGYRVADWAAVEVGGQLSSVGGTGELRVADATLAGYSPALGYAAFPDARYTLQSLRLGAMLRLLAPGRSVIRFVAAAGGGLIGEDLSWTLASSTAPDATLAADAADPITARPDGASGWNGYGQIDLGFELEFSNVFFGLTVQHILQGSRGLTGSYVNGDGYVPYPGPVFLIGPALHLGYGFW